MLCTCITKLMEDDYLLSYIYPFIQNFYFQYYLNSLSLMIFWQIPEWNQSIYTILEYLQKQFNYCKDGSIVVLNSQNDWIKIRLSTYEIGYISKLFYIFIYYRIGNSFLNKKIDFNIAINLWLTQWSRIFELILCFIHWQRVR